MKNLITKITGEDGYAYLSKFADLNSADTLTVHSTNVFNVMVHPGKFKTVINLGKVNDIRFINKFFEAVNSRLDNDDLFIVRVETFAARRERKKVNKIPLLRSLYFGMEFIFL